MLDRLKPPAGSKRSRKRVARGVGTGNGKTGGRGHNGALSRSGGGRKPGFEGGQMPLYRRLPKRGFKSANKREFLLVNLYDLSDAQAGAELGPEELRVLKARRKLPKDGVKVLGNGEIKVAVNLRVHAVSANARKAVEAAGGKIEILAPQPAAEDGKAK